jgi:hypothetical protein
MLDDATIVSVRHDTAEVAMASASEKKARSQRRPCARLAWFALLPLAVGIGCYRYDTGSQVDTGRHVAPGAFFRPRSELGLLREIVGAGGITHGYVHIDDLAELHRLAVVRGAKGSVFMVLREK